MGEIAAMAAWLERNADFEDPAERAFEGLRGAFPGATFDQFAAALELVVRTLNDRAAAEEADRDALLVLLRREEEASRQVPHDHAARAAD